MSCLVIIFSYPDSAFDVDLGDWQRGTTAKSDTK